MGFPTQSSLPGQAYSMNSANSFVGGLSRQTCPLPAALNDVPLVSQKSIYLLTLEEFQNSLGEPGKSFGSMNMEELLKNIWTAEEGQAMAAAMGDGDVTRLSKQASLQKQSSLSLRGALGHKTVDEIWTNFYQVPANTVEPGRISLKQREPTFKEVTLEDFLVKAGIFLEEDAGKNVRAGGPLTFGVSGEMNGNVGPEFVQPAGSSFGNIIISTPTSLLTGNAVDMSQGSRFDSSSPSFQSADMQMNPHANARTSQNSQLLKPSVAGGGLDMFAPNALNLTENAGHVVSPIGLGGLSSPVGGGIAASLNGGFSIPSSIAIPTFKAESPLSSDGTGTSQGTMPLSPFCPSGINVPLRKRLAEGQLETVMERRQWRMIKNRESAARSRARKQAYTVELENELTELREENAKLKKKQERAEKHFNKVLEISQDPPTQQRVLTRTRTATW